MRRQDCRTCDGHGDLPCSEGKRPDRQLSCWDACSDTECRPECPDCEGAGHESNLRMLGREAGLSPSSNYLTWDVAREGAKLLDSLDYLENCRARMYRRTATGVCRENLKLVGLLIDVLEERRLELLSELPPLEKLAECAE